MSLFRKQFLLTSKDNFDLPWPKTPLGKFTLYHHPELNFACRKNEQQSLYMLGLIYAWWKPELDNQGVVDYLFEAESLEKLFQLEAPCMGEYTIVFKNREGLFIFNDASGLSEIYYDNDFTTFGTQPRLISKCIIPRPHSNKDALEFYNSKQFNDNRIFVGNTTHLENVFHLMPNHFINIGSKKVKRFFPVEKVKRLPVRQAAKMAAERLKGSLKAVSLRNKMAIPVTGGFDSRVLFLASLGLKCEYMIVQSRRMSDNHHDITIPRKLTNIFSKPFRVIPYEPQLGPDFWTSFNESLDFPRTGQLAIGKGMKASDGIFYINGNISEIARNYFGYHNHLNGEDLNYLNLFGDRYELQAFPTQVYNSWLTKNRKYFKRLGYHYLDMFFWDEKGGNTCGRVYTEVKALGFTDVTPFNSRELLKLMLSVKRKYRDIHFNRLYENIIMELTDKWEQVFEIPVNPVAGQNKIRKMKKFGVYGSYSYYKLKRRTLII